MPEIIGPYNSYLIGSMANFPLMTRPYWGHYDVPTAVWGEHQHWRDYEAANVQLAPALKGVVLQPSLTPQDMETGAFTISGDVGTCTPPNKANVHLFARNAGALAEATMTSDDALSASPWFVVDFTRAVEQRTNQRWQVRFGNGYVLEWSRLSSPTLSYNGTIISSYPITDASEFVGYASATQMRWVVTCALGNIYITCDAFQGVWTIADRAVPSAVYGFYGIGGQFAVALSAFTFATSGYYITPWLDQFYAFPTEDLLAVAFPGDVNVAVTVEETSGTQARFRVTLTGDGGSTPVVQAVSLEYAPAYAAVSTQWYDISPWVRSAKATLPADGARTIDLMLHPTVEYNGQTLYEWLGSTLQGQFAAKVLIGARYDDGSTDQIPQLLGILSDRREQVIVGKLTELSFTAYDRSKQLREVGLYWPVCCQGLQAGQAVGKVLTRCGIAPADIVISAGADSVYLDDPETDYTNPPYLSARGATGWEFIQHIADSAGLTVQFGADGKAYVNLGHDATVYGSYSIAAGSAADVALEQASGSDRRDTPNMVIVEGQAPDGEPIIVGWQDPQALVEGAPTYLGYIAMRYINAPDCTTVESATVRLNWEVAQLLSQGDVEITSHTAELWREWPDTLIQVGSETVRITSITKELPPAKGRNTAVIQGEIQP